MRRGRHRQDRPPRVGAAVLAKALLGAFLIFASTGAAVAGAGYIQIGEIVPDPPGPTPGSLPEVPVEPPEPGGPRTIMVLGSDRRAPGSTDSKLGQETHSDTIVLVRLDPDRNRIAVLSLPRDLAVTVPGYADGVKINQAYEEGGPALTLRTVKHLFKSATGENFPVNSVVDVSFSGFQRAVNYVRGVYVDIDRKYYNPEGTGYAAINIKAGYQRLVGSDALAYVRYRHADSDIFRNARQQEFLRQAANQREVQDLKSISEAGKLMSVFRQYFRFDKDFMTRRNIAGMLKTGVYLVANDAPVNQIRFRGLTESDDPAKDTRLFVSDDNLREIYDDFMTGERSLNPKPSAAPRPVRAARRVTGLENARRSGEDMAVTATRRLDFPFYFPELRTNGSQYVTGTPRIYSLDDEDGNPHQAYRIVIAAGGPGEYYGVQGLTWREPPILADPDRIRTVDARELMLFYDGSRLRMVGWRTEGAAYWVTNTVSRSISNSRLIAIAASLRRLRS